MKYRTTWKEHPNVMNRKKIGAIIGIIVGVLALGLAAAFLVAGV